jgi:hypothetical protein
MRLPFFTSLAKIIKYHQARRQIRRLIAYRPLVIGTCSQPIELQAQTEGGSLGHADQWEAFKHPNRANAAPPVQRRLCC